MQSTRYLRRADVELRELGDDVFLIDQRTTSIHHLNMTGAAVWRLLAEPMRLADMLETFRQAFPNKSRRILKKKLKHILADLEDSELLQSES
jgi:hypothetical protein